jgi:hypothetical protein
MVAREMARRWELKREKVRGAAGAGEELRSESY